MRIQIFVRLAAAIALFAAASVFVQALPLQTQTASPQPQAATNSALLILNKAENTLSIVDAVTLRVLGKVPTGEGPHEVVASSDGRIAYVANYGTQQKVGNSISIIDILARKEIKRLKVEGAPVGILVAPDGTRAFVAAIEANKVMVIDLEKLEIAGTIEAGQGPDGLAWAAGSKKDQTTQARPANGAQQ